MDDQERTLYCGNLHPDITEDILYELFLQAGPLEKVKIPKDKDGRFRSFAFITFKHEVSVPYAVDLLSNVTLFGRNVRLQSRAAGGSGEGDRGYNRAQSVPEGRSEAPNFYRNNNSTRVQSSYGHHHNESYGRSTMDKNYDCSGSSDPDVEVLRCIMGPEGNSGNGFSERQFSNEKRSVNSSTYRNMPAGPPANSWQNSGSSNQWQNNNNMSNAKFGANPMVVNGGQQVLAFSQHNNNNNNPMIFDPVLEQKMRERLFAIQQQDQIKRMQQFMQNQRLGPYSPFQRPDNSWWP